MVEHFQSEKSQGILSRLEKSGNFTQNIRKTGILDNFFSDLNFGQFLFCVRNLSVLKIEQNILVKSWKFVSLAMWEPWNYVV